MCCSAGKPRRTGEQQRGGSWRHFKAELWFHVLSLPLFYNSVGTVHCAQVPERQTIYSGYEGGFVNVSVPAISSAYSRNYSVLEGSI